MSYKQKILELNNPILDLYMNNELFKKGWEMFQEGIYSTYQFAKFCDRHGFLIF